MVDNRVSQNKNDHDIETKPRQEMTWRSILVRVVFGLVVLGAAWYIAEYWTNNRPRATRKEVVRLAPLVDGEAVEIKTYRATIDAMGTVIPARSMDIASRVGGEVMSVSGEFFPGGHLKSGDKVVEIDKTDYLLNLEEAKYALEKASLAIFQSELAIEQNVLSIEQSILTIEQNELAIEQSKLKAGQSELAIEQSGLNIKQREADVINAEKNLAIERGQQEIAKREFKLLGESIKDSDRDLLLRRPQLKAVEAAVSSAKARLKEVKVAKKIAESAKKSAEAGVRSAEAKKRSAEAAKKTAEAKKKSAEAAKKSAEASKKQAKVAIEKAKLNIERTAILAPFDAVIQEKRVEPGSQVSPGAPLAKLVASSEYWVQVAVPVDRLKWISIPKYNSTEGAPVLVYHESAWGKGVFRTGTVKRLMTSVEEKGRMARLLVSVEDPFSMNPENKGEPELILGAYVRVEIAGNEIPEAIRVPRTAFHNNKEVWIRKDDKTLDIREVDIIWSNREYVFVENSIENGEFLIVSDLPAPVAGMSVRLHGEAVEAPAPSLEEVDADDVMKGSYHGR